MPLPAQFVSPNWLFSNRRGWSIGDRYLTGYGDNIDDGDYGSSQRDRWIKVPRGDRKGVELLVNIELHMSPR